MTGAERDKGNDRHDGQREVELTYIAHEVLVVEPVREDPSVTPTREVVEERAGRERRPDPHFERNQRKDGEHNPLPVVTHVPPPLFSCLR